MMLKHDISLLGHLDNGLGFYRFSYNGSDKAYVGVMAQEVQNVVPNAVVRGSDGYLRVYYEQLGNPDGKPALIVHGGPGGGAMRRPTRAWDPEAYRIIRYDQRNCGRSTPHASDPTADMSLNTTRHLIGDMERLREHLGIEKWLLNGASWGPTLILAYAQQYPERVTEIVIQSVMTSRRSEIEWLYRGAGQFRPEAWDRFRDGVPKDERDGDLLAAYARLMENPDRAVREKAAADWLAWSLALPSTSWSRSTSEGR